MQSGLPCAANGDCPGTQVCVADVCLQPGGAGTDAGGTDGRVDGSLTLDLDGDGVVDGLDSCPAVANAQQFDEDTDGFGDTCDRCPPIADPAQADTDGDLVGDVSASWQSPASDTRSDRSTSCSPTRSMRY